MDNSLYKHIPRVTMYLLEGLVPIFYWPALWVGLFLWAELAFTHMKHFASDYEAVAMVITTNATLFLWSVVAVAL